MSARSRSAVFALALGVVVAGASGLSAGPAFAGGSSHDSISVSVPGTGVDVTDVVDGNGDVQDQSAGTESDAPEVSITSVPLPGGAAVTFADSNEVDDPANPVTDPTPQPEPTSSESPEPQPTSEPSESDGQSSSDQGSGSEDGNSQGGSSESSGRDGGSQPTTAPTAATAPESGDHGGHGGDGGSDH